MRKRERERERDRDEKLLFLFLKGITGALAPFSYLVNNNPRSLSNLTNVKGNQW